MLTHLAFAQLQLGQHEDAASTFTKAKDASGGDDTFDLYLAQAYVSARRFDQALSVLGPLRAKDPLDARLAQLEARALAGSGRRAEAIATLRALTDADADQPSVYLALADILAEDGREAEAMPCSTRPRSVSRTRRRCPFSAARCTSGPRTTRVPRRRSGP